MPNGVRGATSIDDVRRADPRVLALAAKVETFVDAECDRVFPGQFSSVLIVHLRDGATYEERVMHYRGGPDNPLNDAELRTKFELNAGLALPPEAVARLADAVFALDRAASAADSRSAYCLQQRRLC